MVIERLPEPGSTDWIHFAGDHLSRYEWAARMVNGKQVLDAGTGIGYGAAILMTSGAAAVTGVDIDEESIRTAITRFGETGVNYIVCDAESLGKVDTKFDVICSFENIEHLQNPEAFLRSAARVLAPDGVLLCSTPDRAVTPPFRDGKPNNPYHVHEWYRDEFHKLLLSSFKVVEIRVQVKSYALTMREDVMNQLRQVANTSRISSSSLVKRTLSKVGRSLGLLKANPRFPYSDISLDGLAIPTSADYPIINEPLASFYGVPWCHFVICRGPFLLK